MTSLKRCRSEEQAPLPICKRICMENKENEMVRINGICKALLADITDRKGLRQVWEGALESHQRRALKLMLLDRVNQLVQDVPSDASLDQQDRDYACKSISDVLRTVTALDNEWIDIQTDIIQEEIYPVWCEILFGIKS